MHLIMLILPMIAAVSGSDPCSASFGGYTFDALAVTRRYGVLKTLNDEGFSFYANPCGTLQDQNVPSKCALSPSTSGCRNDGNALGTWLTSEWTKGSVPGAALQTFYGGSKTSDCHSQTFEISWTCASAEYRGPSNFTYVGATRCHHKFSAVMPCETSCTVQSFADYTSVPSPKNIAANPKIHIGERSLIFSAWIQPISYRSERGTIFAKDEIGEWADPDQFRLELSPDGYVSFWAAGVETWQATPQASCLDPSGGWCSVATADQPISAWNWTQVVLAYGQTYVSLHLDGVLSFNVTVLPFNHNLRHPFKVGSASSSDASETATLPFMGMIRRAQVYLGTEFSEKQVMQEMTTGSISACKRAD
eukprot:TRINITY_DN7802_c0_g1_i1.p1 TRINITY_DN7802_c0_g1~~TRINITY_DN7802_c0_g1_i1.p1  ORF type:complete len:363 (-),score=65.48 TRINITY_DN7802_c0_g1_i1:54-1142(-)